MALLSVRFCPSRLFSPIHDSCLLGLSVRFLRCNLHSRQVKDRSNNSPLAFTCLWNWARGVRGSEGGAGHSRRHLRPTHHAKQQILVAGSLLMTSVRCTLYELHPSSKGSNQSIDYGHIVSIIREYFQAILLPAAMTKKCPSSVPWPR